MIEACKTDPVPAPGQLAARSPAARTEGLLQRGHGRLSRNSVSPVEARLFRARLNLRKTLDGGSQSGNAHSRESDFRVTALKPHNHDGQASQLSLCVFPATIVPAATFVSSRGREEDVALRSRRLRVS